MVIINHDNFKVWDKHTNTRPNFCISCMALYSISSILPVLDNVALETD